MQDARSRIPKPVLVLVVVVLALGPVAFAAGGHADAVPAAPTGPPLAQIARDAGCRLTEFEEGTLLFENQTGMEPPVAATAYLTVMTCPRVDDNVLEALDAFRNRRRAFGQRF